MVKLIILLRKTITILAGMLLVILLQVPIEGRQGAQSFSLMDSVIISSILYIPQLIVFSDFMYSGLKESGYKINYSLYQYAGLFMVIIVSR
jgi:hypothetical protein